jgi:hypothetical protein
MPRFATRLRYALTISGFDMLMERWALKVSHVFWTIEAFIVERALSWASVKVVAIIFGRVGLAVLGFGMVLPFDVREA